MKVRGLYGFGDVFEFKWPSRKVMKRTVVVTLVAAAISISTSTGIRILVGAQADVITILVRLTLPFIIAIPLALIIFTHLERLEQSYTALLARANELAREASVDPLTGLMNRRSFVKQFELALDHGIKGRFLIADVDYLKTINDLHGHPVGDKAILAIAQALRDVLGDKSLIARIGGDEFCAFVPLAATESQKWPQAIGQAATQLFRESTGLTAERLSITVGAIPSTAGMTFDSAVAAADAVLYGNKQSRTPSAEAALRRRFVARDVPEDAARSLAST